MWKTIAIFPIILILLGGYGAVQAQIYLHGSVTGVLEDTIYIVDGSIYADDLVIEAGARFYFLQFCYFDAGGFFRAVGTEQDSIKFLLAPGASGWNGISFSSSDSSIMEYCYITGSTSWAAMGYSGDFTIRHCVFEGNSGSGAIHCYGSNSTISDCRIVNNGSQGDAAGVEISDATVTISNCTISNNQAIGDGGGIRIHDSRVEVINCVITGNSAQMGGGVYCQGYDSTCAVRFVDCTIANNGAVLYGGGLYFDQSNPTIENCTLSGNLSSADGAAIFCQSTTPTILNTIVFANMGGSAMVFQDSTVASITYSDFSNNFNGNFGGELPDSLGIIVTTNANGDSCDIYRNIYLDPLMVYPDHGDYHLSAGSPCIDAGDPLSPLDPDSTIADIGAFFYDHTSAISDPIPSVQPLAFQLLQNYPNPFNISTTITYDVLSAGRVTVAIYNLLGQRVGILFDGFQGQGRHSMIWDASGMSSGVYIAQIRTASNVRNMKMILLK